MEESLPTGEDSRVAAAVLVPAREVVVDEREIIGIFEKNLISRKSI